NVLNPSQDPVECNTFQYLVADKKDNEGLKLYGVEVSGGDAVMTQIGEPRDIGVSLAFNDAANVLYGVEPNGNAVQTINAMTGETIASLDLDSGLSGIFAAVFNPNDGHLYLSSGSQNKIYKVNLTDGSYETVISNLPIEGGDLVVRNDSLYLFTKEGDRLFRIAGGAAILVNNIPVNINGAALTPNGDFAMVGRGLGVLTVANENGVTVNAFDLTLDGAPFVFSNGDMTSGCIDGMVGDPTGGDACYAEEVVSFEQGMTSTGGMVPANRSDSSTALGTPDKSNAAGGFFSLGIGGTMTLQFSGAVFNAPGDDINVFETSFSGDNCSGANDERAMIELSQDGINFVSVGTICRDGSIDIMDAGLVYVTQIRITDVTTGNGDGYDVDGVEAVNGCQDVPTNDADPCFGSFVVDNSYNPGNLKNGGPITDTNRTDPSKALGAPQDDNTLNFVSLGYGGTITIGFDGAVLNGEGNDIAVLETTFNNATFDQYPESAMVEVSQDGENYYMIGTDVTNAFGEFDISDATETLAFIRFVRLTDTTPADSQSTDGYDLDGIVALTGCTSLEDSTIAALMNQLLSTDNNVLEVAEMVLYPVPAKNTLNVKLANQNSTEVSYEIVSILGQSFNRGTETVRGGEVQISADISGLADGTYFLKVSSNGVTTTKQFVKSSR
ncbi:T9SS type A sorting domain-containing protein, partial [Psychroserpens sp.]|uniref:T9SS type A sorting domain-containing protein n=1 Tax=Psychroserpens sp. TaxID=2020870 RepID=UPI003C755FB8